jgi:hypothetical protein
MSLKTKLSEIMANTVQNRSNEKIISISVAPSHTAAPESQKPLLSLHGKNGF